MSSYDKRDTDINASITNLSKEDIKSALLERYLAWHEELNDTGREFARAEENMNRIAALLTKLEAMNREIKRSTNRLNKECNNG